MTKNVPFSAMDPHRDALLVFVEFFCAKVVGATSIEGFLVTFHTCTAYSQQNYCQHTTVYCIKCNKSYNKSKALT